VAYQLESTCTYGLFPGDPQRGLSQGRAIYQPLLVYGAPPEVPVVAPTVPDAPAAAAGNRFSALAAKHRIEAGEDPLPSPAKVNNSLLAAPPVGPAPGGRARKRR
jgi:hypothetical protein